MVVAASCYGYACHRQGLGILGGIKINGIKLNTGKILEENLVQSAFQQTLGNKFTFQQGNNLKHSQIYTGVAYQDDMECTVPGWPSYSFDLNRLENLWQDLKMAVFFINYIFI
jgi:hypothetical protein